MLQARESMPHFEVTRIDGTPVRYDSIWQRRNLLLVVLPNGEKDGSEEYVARLTDRSGDISAQDAEWVITRDSIPDVPAPGVVIADRWGEVQFVAGSARVAGLPSPDDLLDWLAYVQVKCPECEGESH